MKGISKYILVSIIILLFFPSVLKAQHATKLREIEKAINSGSKYIRDVLLDEKGKSRCEYSIIDGIWVDYEPAWHTGQLIYALSRAHDITNNPANLEAAKKAASWWCSLQIKDHPKLNGMLKAIHMAGVDYIVFATVSDGTAGLFYLHKKTGFEKYAIVPTEAGNWMYHNMYLPEEGLCYDMVDTLSGEVQKNWSAFWPDKEKQVLYDVARPNNEGSLFLDMYNYNGEQIYKDAFLNLSNSLVEKQWDNGLWMDFTPNDKLDHYLHPRFNLWYAESLLNAFELTGEEKYVLAALKTARTYQKIQSKDGTFFYKNYTNGRPPDKSSVSGSTVAFAGIIYLRLLEAGFGSEFEKDIELCKDWLLKNRFAENHPDPNLRGATIETKVRVKKGRAIALNRDVGTSFAIRFLADYYDYLKQKN